jgi:hypothetical protein
MFGAHVGTKHFFQLIVKIDRLGPTLLARRGVHHGLAHPSARAWAPAPPGSGSMGFRAGLKALAQRIGLVKKDEEVEEVVEEGLDCRARAPSLAPAPSAPLSACQAHIDPTSQPPCRNRWYRARAPPRLQGPKIHVHSAGLLVPCGEFAQTASAARRSPSPLCTRVKKCLNVGHACLTR